MQNKQICQNLFKLYASFTNVRSGKQIYSAAERNKQPIADALRSQLDLQTKGLQLLEISAGSGQHAAHFASLFTNINFQPTEYDRSVFPSITAYASDCASKNMLPPLYVDITKHPKEWTEAQFKPASFDYMYNANMMHISPWECTLGLFQAASILLKPSALLFTYGPYAQDGVLVPESNVNFDKSLRSRDPKWGVRDLRDLKEVAKQHGISLKQILDLPSNNKLVTWIKSKQI